MTRSSPDSRPGFALTEEPLSDDSLAEERDAIVHAGRLHWFHWLVIALSMAVTLIAWSATKGQIDEKVKARFDREATQVVSLISERLEKYEDALWAGGAAIQALGGATSSEQWSRFATNLRIDVKYPGISGIGVIDPVARADLPAYIAHHQITRPDFHVHPPHDQLETLPISVVEPVGPNAKAVGLDMAHETNRYSAAKKARASGTAQITGPIVLVQDAGKTPGFLFYTPFYNGGTYEDPAERRKHFAGIVYAPFVVKRLMEGVLDAENRHVGVRISDGSDTLYDEHVPEFPDFDPDPVFTTVVETELYGRRWRFDIWTAQSFRDEAASNQPLVILLGGVLLDSLLFYVFMMLSRANRRAVRFADNVTGQLRYNTDRLERSNEELEQFAYVASHDLKTPLRGIGDLTEYLEEDLADYLQSDDANPDVQRNLQRMGGQVDRMNSLIKGVLDYSRVGTTDSGEAELVEISKFIADARADLGLDPSQLQLDGAQQATVPGAVHFRQVIDNLVANAFNHHHDPGNARVVVTVSEDVERLRVSVRDDGPGIDPRYQDRIFGVFQTLDTNGTHTGVGLSIVKKIVARYGGQISIESQPGEGATFTFDWATKTVPALAVG